MDDKEILKYKTWTLTIEKVSNGKSEEHIISLPEDLLKDVNWKKGDKLFWIYHSEGPAGPPETPVYEVRKASKEELHSSRVIEAEQKLERLNRSAKHMP